MNTLGTEKITPKHANNKQLNSIDMEATALKALLRNADPIAYGLGMTANELVEHWVNNPKAIPGLIEDYESDYNMMLADFGADDKDVISYKDVIYFLKSLKAFPSV